MAIVKEKKKRYGIQKLNKEENKRLRERTEERILVSQAKANYWKKWREKKEEGTEMMQEWGNLMKGIIALEERGGWRVTKDDLMQHEQGVLGDKVVDDNEMRAGVGARDVNDDDNGRAGSR